MCWKRPVENTGNGICETLYLGILGGSKPPDPFRLGRPFDVTSVYTFKISRYAPALMYQKDN